MNKKTLDKVKEELLQNIKCQNCWSDYENKNVTIKSLWWSKNFISANCDKCWVYAEFQAEIMEQEDAEKIYKKEINDWDLKVAENWKNVDYKKSEFSKEFEEIKEKKEKIENVWNSVIKEEEINVLTNSMSNFSSFKNLFSLCLVFSVFFTWCADTAEENRQNILDSINSAKTQFEETKDQAEEAYEIWKENFETVKKIVEEAPEKIEKAKADIEKITSDAIKLKEDLEKKVEDTKKAVDETKKAVDAVSDAMDSISAIWWVETWIWENN